jgi:hypothetical protein
MACLFQDFDCFCRQYQRIGWIRAAWQTGKEFFAQKNGEAGEPRRKDE